MSTQKTGFVSHEHYFWHDTGNAAAILPAGLSIQPDRHAENAETKRRMLGLLDVAGILKQLIKVEPRSATLEEICRFHTLEYVNSIAAMSESGGGDAGELTPVGRGSYEIALLSAGGCLAALEAILNKQVRNAYALVRPPGHHAEADRGRGFCLFGNGVITALHAKHLGVKRVAIVDWDVHHGNSQETAFLSDSSVLTLSVHQDNYYPAKRGGIDVIGEGKGHGANLNVPLPPGSGHGAYVEAFKRVIAPALQRFQPELIIISSGFDGNALDPLGRMMASSETYREITTQLVQLSEELCNGRLLAIHEGGYSTAYVPYCGLATLEAMSGLGISIEDPFLSIISGMGGQELQNHQSELIKKAAELVMQIPEP